VDGVVEAHDGVLVLDAHLELHGDHRHAGARHRIHVVQAGDARQYLFGWPRDQRFDVPGRGAGEGHHHVGHRHIDLRFFLLCPSPDGCEVGRKGGCKPYGRLNVRIDGQGDELGSFIFRTTGFNSIRTLSARLNYFEAVSGGQTRYLPLLLKLRAKSTTQSRRAPIYYVDLCLRDGMTLSAAVAQAKDAAAQDESAGVAMEALETVARQAIANGAFEDGEEEVPAIVEEFFPEKGAIEAETGELLVGRSLVDGEQSAASSSLASKLEQKVEDS
jgi:hypothetical protein